MSDLISRQAAIDGVKTLHLVAWKNWHEPSLSANTVLDMIRELPSAQPQRMRGHWIIKDNPGTGWYRVTCSECGEDVTSNVPVIGYFPNAKVLWDFCPYCGADMRGGEQE